MKSQKYIEITGAKQHNLKNISLRIPKPGFTVITGPSGSGKSSLAFNTVFAEGQRRYMESLSTYARQFLNKHEKPDVDSIANISPTIAIEQKNHVKSTRSTVGTSTEVYDYLRLLFSKIGKMICPLTGKEVKKDLVSEIVFEQLKKNKNAKALICFPLEISAHSKLSDRQRLFASIMENGFTRCILTNDLNSKKKKLKQYDIQEELALKSSKILGKEDCAEQVYIVSDRMVINNDNRGRLEEALAQAYSHGLGRSHLLILNEAGGLAEHSKYSEFPSTDGGITRFPELSPLLFSFNSPMGACPECNGFGHILKIDPNLVVPNPALSISQGAIEPFSKPSAREYLKQVILFCKNQKISINLPWELLTKLQREWIWDGKGDFQGINGLFKDLHDQRYKMQVRVFLSRYRSPTLCPTCNGQRLKPEALSVFVQKKNIGDLSKMSIEDLYTWFNKAKFTKTESEIAKDVIPQIQSRLDFLMRVGLNYLSLGRLAKTLSGGESQRIALANQLGSRLTQTCYVLDEPSIGLHPQDTEKLIGIIKELSKLKNSVIVVEHDADIIKNAEYLIDIGPHAGENGGQLMYEGAFSKFLDKDIKESTTWSFLKGVEKVPAPRRRRLKRHDDIAKKTNWIKINGCSENNLKNVNLEIPLGTLTCVTGVSGSGKSTAVRQTLYPALARILRDKSELPGEYASLKGFEALQSIVLINQDPIGRSPRSNPITYMKVYDEIRGIFANTRESKRNRYHAGHFSFNVPGGRCEHCEGDGYQKVEMLFMEDLFILCDHCEGQRFKKKILEIKHKEKNIHDVLSMTVNQSKEFFSDHKKLSKFLGILQKVGLGYLKLGQPATTLSGGESQRLKIARELSAIDRTGILYVLDEPTTGLHFRDVKVLIKVLHQLVEYGNSAIVIEHNLDMIKSADYVIDFGPGGGVNGGEIVAQGTPEEIIENKKSVTGKYLKEVLKTTERVALKDYFTS